MNKVKTTHGEQIMYLRKIEGQIRGIQRMIEEGKYCVDIDVQSVNQTGTVTVTGGATVILPSREHGPVIYPVPYARVPYTTAGK